ncbi:hypothetical protein TPHA_0J01910 [Tetrapisispora phaffii CBS 4417]|uniref:Oligopeptide transporter n=1 Tax=Tetrapisispora phaffii (strain ATCC 24235 / CBS 4417 / NBRC 1672 / NRRL Y-8282 / UCD 70-5) TaxID=1071381 RepID=G8BYS0_TETPH|nr:hypothetical protein TPHA_0J01910 [Tetrapisispora phaffii CBS 4417]CCE65012.1 hypothetical protein TPHA_0J01910 [Tetrapisispora phaffii CBS 4417]
MSLGEEDVGSMSRNDISLSPVSNINAQPWKEKQELRQITLRGTVAGLTIGTLVLISNFQFGLQTGWVSMMSLPSALLACAFFKQIWPTFFPEDAEFTDVETVYVQSMAVAVGTGPLAYGFIGVIPAIEKFMTREEMNFTREEFESFTLIQLLFWSCSLAFFGIFFAVPLRRQVIIREKLPFPSGSATAVLISILTGSRLMQEITKKELIRIRDRRLEDCPEVLQPASEEESMGLLMSQDKDNHSEGNCTQYVTEGHGDISQRMVLPSNKQNSAYSKNMEILVKTFSVSALYTLVSYFVPKIKEIKIFGRHASDKYDWNLQPSPAYIGQGIIMGLRTVTSMLFGSILGWGVLACLAYKRKWIQPDVDPDDWQNGLHGWLIWISLSIMIADSLVGLIILIVKNIVEFISFDNRLDVLSDAWDDTFQSMLLEEEHIINQNGSDPSSSLQNSVKLVSATIENEVGSKYLINSVTVISGLIVSSIICIVVIVYLFGVDIIPIYAMTTALLLALVLSVLGIRALGETDLNPVSGIGKLSQLIFALIIPSSHSGAVLLNVVAGGVAEAGAQQAGDLMQDLKTGHLLGASPKAQFYAQIIGATWSIFMSSIMYKIYNIVYELPNNQFRIPTALVWIDCARLITGQGLPPMALECSIIFGCIFSILSLIRNCEFGNSSKFRKWIPSGIAVGVGMYNAPSFTIARFIGGVFSHYWLKGRKGSFTAKTCMIVFSSGLILGEGILSIMNMIFTQFKVPHL